MSQRSNLLSNYPGFSSRNPEYVRGRMSRLFGTTRFDVVPSGHECAAHYLRLNDVTLIHARYPQRHSLGFAGASFVRQYFTLGGTGRFSTGARLGELSIRSPSPIIPAYTPVDLDFERSDLLVLRIEYSALKRYLAVLIGREIDRDIVFHDDTGTNPAVGSLRRGAFHFASDYNARGQNLSDLVVVETERILIMKFLMSNWHNYTLELLRTPPQVSNSAIRKVKEFIEANWNKPIDVEGMAAVANVSARSLFRQFRKDCGCSPAEFAKQIRLARAKEMLERGGADATVVDIAFSCGFQNAGHFARDFKLAFGELPSEALKRADAQRH
jgi:AraC-like DNA-binding protein